MTVVEFTKAAGVGHVILRDPPENPLSQRWAADLRTAVHEEGEADIRALVLRAEGPNFEGGGKVAEYIGKDVR